MAPTQRQKKRAEDRKRLVKLLKGTKPLGSKEIAKLRNRRNFLGSEIVNWLKRGKNDLWESYLVSASSESLDADSHPQYMPLPKVVLRRVIAPDWQIKCRKKALKKARRAAARTANAVGLWWVNQRDAATKLMDEQKECNLPADRTSCKGCKHTFSDVVAWMLPLVRNNREEANKEARIFLRQHGILPQSVTCPRETCGRKACSLLILPTSKTARSDCRYIWRCKKVYYVPSNISGKMIRKRCTYEVSDNSGTILEQSHISPSEFLLIVNAWCRKSYNQEILSSDLGLAESTISFWKAKLDCMCTKFVRRPDANHVIGGPGIVVELDESIVSRKKMANLKARPQKNLWVFGGTERHGRRRFLVPLLKTVKGIDGKGYTKDIPRTASNLLPLIQAHVAPGSIIMTDKWKSYNTLPQHPSHHPDNVHMECPDHLKYQHFDVNHGYEFVREDDPYVHCNGVERMWRDMKEWMSRPGQRRLYLRQYIARYQVLVGNVRKRSSQKGVKRTRIRSEKKRFHNALKAAASVYPHKGV